jgi:hypothetical protein
MKIVKILFFTIDPGVGGQFAKGLQTLTAVAEK